MGSTASRGAVPADLLGDRMEYRDVMVAPFTDLLDGSSGGLDHRGGPSWPDWDAETPARHRSRNVPIDVEPVPSDPIGVVDEPLAWGGPITYNYGHQLASFSMRLVSTLAAWPDATVAFAGLADWGWRGLDDIPAFATQILDWLAVPPERRRLVTEPLRARELAVWPQAEQHHGPGPSEAHLDRMDALVDRRLPDRPKPAGVLYVSRAQTHARFAGEAYIEVAMAAAGARVIRPEDLSVSNQIRAWLSAEVAVFAEGSAVATSRLLGRQPRDVIVVVRRPGNRIAEEALAPRCRSLSYRSSLAGVLAGLDFEGVPFEVLGLPIVEPDQLVRSLRDVLPHLEECWDPVAFAAVRDRDVLAWLERSLASERMAGDDSWAYMLECLPRLGVGHLGPVATQMIAARRAAADDSV